MLEIDVGVALIFFTGVTAMVDAQPTWNRACSHSESQCFQPDVCSYRLSFPRNENAECPALGELVNQQERLETLEQRLREMTLQIVELQRQTVGRNMTKACLAGWRYFSDRCYLLNSNHLFTWPEAYEICNNAGGRLAIVNSEDVDTFLKPLIGHRLIWIGLHDMRSEDQWQWINGRSLQASYSNWYPGEPNNGRNIEHCAEVRGNFDGTWNDEDCTQRRGYLCEYNTGCGTGWHNFEEKCYRIHSTKYSIWNEANTVCEQLESKLVTVHYDDVNAFLVELTRDRSGPFWIGLNNAAAEGKWIWTDGSMLTYSNWSPGQPNDTNSGGNCALFQGTAGFWEVAGCSESYQIICEKFVE